MKKNAEFTMDDIKEKFKSSKNEAEEMINDSEKTQKMLSDSIDKAKKLKDGPIAQVWEDLQLFFSLVKDWVSKSYTEIPTGSIIAIVGALIYFLSPIDLIPDFIPVIGLLDDVFVIGMVINQVHDDLQAYKSWKQQA